MWTRHRRKPRIRLLIIPFLCCLAISYFSYHAVIGRFGLESMARYQAQRIELQAELDQLVAKRDELQHRTSLLREGTLEQDMIDELARQKLGMTRANEIVLLHSSN